MSYPTPNGSNTEYTMHLLPLHIAKVADMADKDNSTRFSLSAVHLTVTPPVGKKTPASYVVEATDSKRLIRVSGECQYPANEYPAHAALDAADDWIGKESKSVLVPAGVWTRAFSMANKLKRAGRVKPVLASLACKLGKETATFGASDLDSYPVENTRYVEGRFPPTDDIIKQTTKETKHSFAVDPLLLAELLKAIHSMQGGDNKRVEFYVAKDKPIRIVARGANGEKIEAVIMPLCGDPDEPPTPAAKTSKAAYDKAAKEQAEAAMKEPEAPPAEPLPDLAFDQRRQPDADPHACVTCGHVDCTCIPENACWTCHEVDCVCEQIAEEPVVEDVPAAPPPPVRVPLVITCNG